eukprot:199690-Pyramimonas_sp.AAC.1
MPGPKRPACDMGQEPGIKWQNRASMATSPFKPPELIPLDDPEIGDIIKGGGPQDIDIDAIDPVSKDMEVSVTMPRFQGALISYKIEAVIKRVLVWEEKPVHLSPVTVSENGSP